MNTGVFEYVCAYVSELQYYKLFLEEKSTFFFFSLHEFYFVWCSCDVDPGLKAGNQESSSNLFQRNRSTPKKNN